MHTLRPRSPNQVIPSRQPAIEALESRTLLSTTGTAALLVTIPGPLPATAIAGAKINARIEVNIANDGSGKSSGRTTVTLFASRDGILSNDDIPLGAVTKSLTISAGSHKNVAIKVGTVPQSLDGNYFLLADVVTPAESVQGVSATAISVAPPFVDLSGAIAAVPTTAHIGGKISVTLEVTNLGNETVKGNLGTLFELSVNSNGSDPIQLADVSKRISIKAGRSEKLRLTVPVALGGPSGNQFIVAVLDPNDVFNDSNPGNNTAVSAAPVSFT